LSDQSRKRVIPYAPTTSASPQAGSVAMRREATSSAVTQAAQAQLTSKVAARRAPSLACTTEAVAGLR